MNCTDIRRNLKKISALRSTFLLDTHFNKILMRCCVNVLMQGIVTMLNRAIFFFSNSNNTHEQDCFSWDTPYIPGVQNF